VKALAVLLLLTGCAAGGDWRPLFNGKDLSGWETFLAPTGLNRDPSGVFSVVEIDGAPALRISGEFPGGLITTSEFGDYHFRVEFKWGSKRWPPRDQDVRDSGILYHSVGPHGAGGGAWMESLQLSLAEGDCGDLWAVAGATADMEGDRVELGKDAPPELAAWMKRNGMTRGRGARYRKGGEKVALTEGWAIKHPDAEKPFGKWNVIDLYAVGRTSVHVVNGKVVMVLTDARRKSDEALARGRIQLQSEGAEVYYRNPSIRPLATIPMDLQE